MASVFAQSPLLTGDLEADVAAVELPLDAKIAETQEEVQGANEDQEETQIGRDLDALRHAFALFDADGDNKLTEDEVIAVLTRKTGQGTELSEGEARDTWERWQALYDFYRDGKISYDELVKYNKKLRDAEQAQEAFFLRAGGRSGDLSVLRSSFDLFDADGEGKLTEDEVVAVLTRKTGQGTELSEEHARMTWERWVAEFDMDKDGKISFEELVVAEF